MIDRVQRFSAHRIKYLNESGKAVKGSDRLLKDWNEKAAPGGKEVYKIYNAWLTTLLHDKRDLKKLLLANVGTEAEGSTAESEASPIEDDEV